MHNHKENRELHEGRCASSNRRTQKTTSRLLSLCAAVAMATCLAVAGTLAFLNAKTTSIINTFELGDIEYTLTLNANTGYINSMLGTEKYSDDKVDMPSISPSTTQKVAAGHADFTVGGDPSLTGYTFEGWHRDSACNTSASDAVSGSAITVSYGDANTSGGEVSIALYAKWEPIQYTVIYDANDKAADGSEVTPATGATVSSSHTFDEYKCLTENGFDRTGYTFIGWNTKPDGSGKSYSDGESVANLTSEDNAKVTLYAQWGVKSYVIRYHANGGEGAMADQAIKYDSPTPLTKNAFSLEDHSFLGWALSEDGEVKYIDEQTVVNLKESGVLDLYAVWVQDSHTVYFDYNGGEGSTKSKQFLNGQAYGQLPEYPVHPTETVGDNKVMTYLFTGWYTQPNGGVRVYPDTIANRTDDHTLYAHWQAAPSNNVIQNMVVKNNPDDNRDGVVDDLYLQFTCTSSFEKYNIPLTGLIPGQTYKLTYNASNNASFGDYVGGYKNSVYGSYILAESALTGGRIEGNYDESEYVAQVLASWNSRKEPDGNNDGSQAAINDGLLQGPWKNQEIVFTATASTMYWTWDFGLMQDNIQNDYNMTDITLELVVPEIRFGEKELVIYNTSKAQVLNDSSSAYANSFVFDGDGYAETMYFPITGLTAGTTYTVTFDHKITGALINNSSYDYGCGVSSVVPTAYGSYMKNLGATWISGTKVFTQLNKTESVTLTFTATGSTAYWVWNMANCSDTTNCPIDIKVTNFSAKHAAGGSITYYAAASKAMLMMAIAPSSEAVVAQMEEEAASSPEKGDESVELEGYEIADNEEAVE